MRDYAKQYPSFWTNAIGKRLKSAGPAAVVVALYLETSPHSNMLGLYWLPKLYLAHETGLGVEGASEALRRVIEAGFCRYDEASEVVWVVDMAVRQLAKQLKAADNQVKSVQREYDALPENAFLSEFYDRHWKGFHLADRRTPAPENGRALQGPSEPLRSQEQEQEQEQDPPSQEGREPREVELSPRTHAPLREAGWDDAAPFGRALS